MKNLSRLMAAALLMIAAFASTGCWLLDNNQAPLKKNAAEPDRVSGDTTFYSHRGERFATFDGKWWIWDDDPCSPFFVSDSIHLPPPSNWVSVKNRIVVEIANNADAIVAKAVDLSTELGGAVQFIDIRGAAISIVIPQPPFTPDVEEMRRTFGDGRVLPGVSYQIHLRQNFPLIDFAESFYKHRDLVRRVNVISSKGSPCQN